MGVTAELCNENDGYCTTKDLFKMSICIRNVALVERKKLEKEIESLLRRNGYNPHWIPII